MLKETVYVFSTSCKRSIQFPEALMWHLFGENVKELQYWSTIFNHVLDQMELKVENLDESVLIWVFDVTAPWNSGRLSQLHVLRLTVKSVLSLVLELGASSDAEPWSSQMPKMFFSPYYLPLT